jgi:hypothetical protein
MDIQDTTAVLATHILRPAVHDIQGTTTTGASQLSDAFEIRLGV